MHHDLFRYKHSPPEYEATTWVMKFKSDDPEALGEFFEHVFVFGQDILEGSHSQLDGTLVLRILTFKNDPEQFNDIFINELATWPEIKIIHNGEDTPCQEHNT